MIFVILRFLKGFTICLSNNSKVVFELKESSGLKGEGMDISIIAAQLVKENVISHYPNSIKVLNGGTTSTVYLLDGKYVVKLNEAEVIREEAHFLSFMRGILCFQSFCIRNLSIRILCILFLKVVRLANKGINEVRFVHS